MAETSRLPNFRNSIPVTSLVWSVVKTPIIGKICRCELIALFRLRRPTVIPRVAFFNHRQVSINYIFYANASP